MLNNRKQPQRLRLQTLEPQIKLNGPDTNDCFSLFKKSQLHFVSHETGPPQSKDIGQSSSTTTTTTTRPYYSYFAQQRTQEADIPNSPTTSDSDYYSSDSMIRSASEDEESEYDELERIRSLTPTTTKRKSSSSYSQGPWTKQEHDNFMEGYMTLGHRWALIAEQYVPTRSRRQVASHAQKYLEKLARHSSRGIARELH
jgi:SHAQKYF class myb-like DNA-binding protein